MQYFLRTLLFLVAPTITEKSKSEVTVIEGNVLYLVCVAAGFPTPHISWRKNGDALQKGINKSNVIIDIASKKDAGNYECKVSNSVGTVSHTMEVTVKGKSEYVSVNKTLSNTFYNVLFAQIRRSSRRRQLS